MRARPDRKTSPIRSGSDLPARPPSAAAGPPPLKRGAKVSGGSKPTTRVPVSLPSGPMKRRVGTPWMLHFSRSAAAPSGAAAAPRGAAAAPSGVAPADTAFPTSPAAPAPPPAAGGAKRSELAGFASDPAFATSRVSVAVSSAGGRHWLSLQGWYEITAVSVRGPGAAFASTVPCTRKTVRPS